MDITLGKTSGWAVQCMHRDPKYWQVRVSPQVFADVPVVGLDLRLSCSLNCLSPFDKCSYGVTTLYVLPLASQGPLMLQDPDSFTPDRFMEGTPESKAVNPDAWVPFGGGVRACVGEKFAMAVCTQHNSSLFEKHKC